MKKKTLLITILFLIGLAASLSAALANGGGAAIQRKVFGGGVKGASGGNVSLRATLGQPAVGASSGGNVSLGAGYWHGLGYDEPKCSLAVDSNALSVVCADDNQVTVTGTVTLINNGCNTAVTSDIPMRFTLYDNTGCGGGVVEQWTDTFSSVNIAGGGGTQAFTISNHTFTSDLCANSTGCQVSVLIEADYNDTVCESDGTDNTRCSNQTVNIPDLRVNSVTPANNCTADGSVSGTVTVNVENIGCGDVVGAVVQLTSSCGGITFANQTVDLTAGSNSNLTFNYTPAAATCTCDFTAAIDPGNLICESNNTNNSVTFSNYTPDVPDLEVTADTLSASCSNDGEVSVTGDITIANNGCGSFTSDIPVRFTLYDNTGCAGNVVSTWTETFTGVNINGGGGTQVIAISAQSIATDLVANSTNCQFSIQVEADYNNSVCEFDGANNTYCADNKNVDIPDLEGQSNTLSVTCTNDGEASISGSVTIVNNGCGSNMTTDIPLRFTLFDNTGCSGNQLAQWTETLSSANIPSDGGTQIFTITPYNMTADLCDNSTDCQVSIRIEVDYSNAICECDGADNTLCTSKLPNVPDLTVNSVTLSIAPGGDGMVTANVSNTGCGDANGAVVRLTSDCGLGPSDQTVDLASGGNADLVFNFTSVPTDCTFVATIDPDQAVCECDGANNARSTANEVDTDRDGVPDAVEDGAPNGGDGNNDGLLDSRQGNVASLPNAVDGRYVTLVSPPGTNLANVQAVDTPADAPADIAFLVGLFQFTVEGLAPGGATVVTMLLPPEVTVGTYYKHGPNPPGAAVQWYEFLFDGATGAQFLAGQVVLSFVDGQRGDDLAGPDSQVVDQGGPGQPLFTLTVNKVGSGRVTSDPAGINCGADCTEDYVKYTDVTLTAHPGVKSYLASWGGDCTGSGITAQVTMDSDKTCTAAFGYPVGGIVVPVNKVGLLSPWLGLAALAGLAALGVALVRSHRG